MTPPTGAASEPKAGAPAEGMMPMEMCGRMMTGGGMMPMSAGSRSMAPKLTAQMMEMHGEMMKAMGDIMMRHAKKMLTPESSSAPLRESSARSRPTAIVVALARRGVAAQHFLGRRCRIFRQTMRDLGLLTP